MTRMPVSGAVDSPPGARGQDRDVSAAAEEKHPEPLESGLRSASDPGQFEAIFERLADGVISLGSEGQVLSFNRAAREVVIGLEKGQPAAQLWRLLPQLAETSWESEYARALREERPLSFELCFPEPRRWCVVALTPLPNGSMVSFRDITEQKRGGAELRASTERFRLAASSGSLTLYEQDVQLRYTWLYPEQEAHAGALGKSDEEILGAEGAVLLTHWKKEVLSTGVSLRKEIEVRLPSGTRVYEMSILPKRDERDQIIGVAGAALDLSERSGVEEASQRLAAIVESSHDAIISKNLDGIITSWNHSAQRIFGYTADEIVGQHITRLMPADRQSEELEIIAQMRMGNRVDHYETVRQHKNGSYIEVSLTVSPVRDRAGRVVGVSKIARDISARRQGELQQQALYELVARVNRAEALPEIYNVALDAICRCQRAPRAAILLLDSGGVTRFKAWRGLSEVYRQAVEGHSPWKPDEPSPQAICIDDVATSTLSEPLRQAVLAEGIRALAFVPLTYERRYLGKFMIYYDSPHNFAAGELKPVETMASQVAFALKRQEGEDALEALVSERTRSLREAIAQMEEFSYSVSHDLRSPARAMQGYADALLEDYGECIGEAGREYLYRIIRSSTRMDCLIQDILTYSRLNRRELHFQTVQLEKLVAEVIQQYPEMAAQGAQITLLQPLLPVVGHEPSISQILSNLLGNAVKFVAPGIRPQVTVSTEQKGTLVRLWVKDNGIGIRPEHHARLFGMFERIHPDKSYNGTGIGLAIVRKAAERMGGAAGVVSDGETGSRFWVELPGVNPPSSLS